MPRRRRKGMSMAHASAPSSIISLALVNLSGDNLVLSSGNVAEMVNQAKGGADYDLDVGLGTAANGKPVYTGRTTYWGASGDFTAGAVLSITSSVAVASYISPDDITPAAITTIAAQSTSGQISFEFVILTDGKLRKTISADGTAVVNGDSTASIAGDEWVLGIWDDVANDVNFYTAPGGANVDPTTLTWTQLGTADVALSSVGMKDSSAVLEIGGNTTGTSERFLGNIGRTLVWSGVTSVTAGVLTAGTEAADSDPSKWTTGTNYSSGGDTYTLTGDSFVQNTEHTVVHSIGTFGLESTAGQTISNPQTTFAVAAFTSISSGARLLDARASAGGETTIFSNGSASNKWAYNQDAPTVTLDEAFDTDPHVFTFEARGGAASKLTVSGVGSKTGDGGNESWDYGTLFADRGASNTMKGYIAQLLVFDFALNASQVASVQRQLSQKYGI